MWRHPPGRRPRALLTPRSQTTEQRSETSGSPGRGTRCLGQGAGGSVCDASHTAVSPPWVKPPWRHPRSHLALPVHLEVLLELPIHFGNDLASGPVSTNNLI